MILRKKNLVIGISVVAPSIIAIAIFVYGFISWTLRVSFSNWNSFSAPGITRGLQWINLGKIKLLDTPGIVFAKLFNKDIAAKLLLVGSLPIENIDNYDIISKAFGIYKTEVGIENDFEDYIEKFGISRGFISKGGKCDFERSKNTFFKLLSEGKLGKFTYDKDFSMWIFK